MAALQLGSTSDAFAEDEHIELEASQMPPPSSPLKRFTHWFANSTSIITVLWILLLSEAIRGIVLPTQAKYVHSVRSTPVVAARVMHSLCALALPLLWRVCVSVLLSCLLV